jgi:short-subunit dehydrogenase
MVKTDSPKTALITGASSGIGYELTQVFARNNYDLVLVARSEDKLNQMAQELTDKFKISVKVVVEDLSEPESSQRIFEITKNEGITVDILVNNAGFGLYGFFQETDLIKELQMLQVNVVALTHLTKLFLPDMIAKKSGKILNLASTAAFQPGPLMAVYYATKAYVLSFSEALSNELEQTGVSVTVLCPGPTKSAFQAQANLEESKLFKNNPMMDSKTVAEIGYQGLINQRTVVIPGLRNQFLAALVRFLPRSWVLKIVRDMQETTH